METTSSPSATTAETKKPFKQKTRSGAGTSVVVIVVLAAVSTAGALSGLFQEDGQMFARSPYRGFVEIALNWFTILGFLTLPFWSICLTIAAMRGTKSGSYAAPRVVRAESPVAFWYVFVLYLALAVGGILGLVAIITSIASKSV